MCFSFSWKAWKLIWCMILWYAVRLSLSASIWKLLREKDNNRRLQFASTKLSMLNGNMNETERMRTFSNLSFFFYARISFWIHVNNLWKLSFHSLFSLAFEFSIFILLFSFHASDSSNHIFNIGSVFFVSIIIEWNLKIFFFLVFQLFVIVIAFRLTVCSDKNWWNFEWCYWVLISELKHNRTLKYIDVAYSFYSIANFNRM